MSEALTVLVTAPDRKTAEELARSAVEARLAACGNVIPGLVSVYRWEDEVREDEEVLILFKTVSGRMDALTAHIVATHPYDVPEVLALPVTRGHGPYLDWVRSESSG